jgi:uncharacterized surface protein with fasciclin (FAS1) repeats
LTTADCEDFIYFTFGAAFRNTQTMKKLALVFVSTLFLMSSFVQVSNKSPIHSEGTIAETVASSKDHSTLFAALKAGSLVEILKGSGPYTVFAPTNSAFDKLPAGTIDGLLKPESKATLAAILTYHVVMGKISAEEILAKIKEGDGSATLTTVQGGTLTASLKGSSVVLTDGKGGMSTVTSADMNQSNGVIHVVDSVMMPK